MKRLKTALLSFAGALGMSFATIVQADIQLQFDERPSFGKEVDASDFTVFFHSFKGLALAISGICAITAMIFFAISLAKLSASAGNDQARTRAMRGVLFSGAALILFGGASVLVGIFWNIIV